MEGEKSLEMGCSAAESLPGARVYSLSQEGLWAERESAED